MFDVPALIKHGFKPNDVPSNASVLNATPVWVSQGREGFASDTQLPYGIFQQHGTVMMIINPGDGRILDANEAAVRFYGHPKSVLLGMRISDINTLSPDEVAAQMQTAGRKETNRFTFQHKLADGQIRHVDVSSWPIQISGSPVLFSIVQDITEAVQAGGRIEELLDQRTLALGRRTRALFWTLGAFFLAQSGVVLLLIWALRKQKVLTQTIRADGDRLRALSAEVEEARDQYQSLVENIPGITYHCKCDKDWTMLFMTDAVVPISGYPASDFINNAVRTFESVMLPEDSVFVSERIHTALAAGVPWDIEYRVRHKDGGIRWVHEKGQGIPDHEGHVAWLDGFILDISEKRRAEDALQLERQRLAGIIEGTHVGTWEWNVQTGETVFNARWGDIVGYRLDELGPVSIKTWMQFAHPDDLAESERRLHAHFAGQSDYYEFESRMRHRCGDWVWVLDRGRVMTWTTDGKPLMMLGTHQDITERMHAEASRRELLERLQALGRHLPGFIYQFHLRMDGTSCFPFASEGIEQIYGVKPEDVRDNAEAVFAVLDPADLERISASISESARQMAPWRETYRVRLPWGTIWVAGTATPQRLGDGSTLWHGYIHDITASKQVEDALRQAKLDAEAANAAKSQFLANVSHEIRTPMNAVIGLARLLEDTKLDSQQQAQLAKIRRSSRVLLGVINDVLDFSKIEAGKLELHLEAFDLEDILAQIRTLFGDAAREKGIALWQHISKGLPVRFVGDSMRLTQVLTNLVSNAIKFTEAGHVSVRITECPFARDDSRNEVSGRPESTSERLVSLHFSVVDTGIGMTGEQVSRLFRPFTQADSSTTRKYGGTGLGLVISQRLVAAMGGVLEVVSAPDEGSCFGFSIALPVTASRMPDTSSGNGDTAVEALPQFPGINVLLVEDNLINQEVAGSFLAKTGVRVLVANNGQEALACMQAEPIDLVLMDLQMPVMDGFEATRRLRQREQERGVKRVPIIALSAAVMDSDRAQAIEAGVDGQLDKPLDDRALYRLMAGVLPRPTPDARNASPEPPARKDVFPELVGFDRARGIDISQGDISFYYKLLRLFDAQLETLPADVLDCLTTMAPSQVQDAMHTLKGVAANLGAIQVAPAAAAIDQASKRGAAITGAMVEALRDVIASAQDQIAKIDRQRMA